eukprot:1148453-Pelagomonas_calceolata.AAC.4
MLGVGCDDTGLAVTECAAFSCVGCFSNAQPPLRLLRAILASRACCSVLKLSWKNGGLEMMRSYWPQGPPALLFEGEQMLPGLLLVLLLTAATWATRFCRLMFKTRTLSGQGEARTF